MWTKFAEVPTQSPATRLVRTDTYTDGTPSEVFASEAYVQQETPDAPAGPMWLADSDSRGGYAPRAFHGLAHVVRFFNLSWLPCDCSQIEVDCRSGFRLVASKKNIIRNDAGEQ